MAMPETTEERLDRMERVLDALADSEWANSPIVRADQDVADAVNRHRERRDLAARAAK